MEEFELTFLNINQQQIENKLQEIGAEKKGEFHYRRTVFDFPGFTLDAQGAWLRLRDEGDKIILAYKRRLGIRSKTTEVSDDGMEEIEIEVEGFEKTREILLRLGLIEKFYQENKRIRWQKDDVTYDIDLWPKIEPYLEIEASSRDTLLKGVAVLGLDPKIGRICSNFQIYMDKGIDIREYQRMTFEEFTKRNNT